MRLGHVIYTFFEENAEGLLGDESYVKEYKTGRTS